MAQYWIGQDGNVWLANNNGGVENMGKPLQKLAGGIEAQYGSIVADEIADPNPGNGSTTTTTTKSSEEDDAKAKEAAERAALRGEIGGYQDDINSLYEQLFSDLDSLVKTRKDELEGQYGEQLEKAGSQYAKALPEIQRSYAALGAQDSTNNTYAKLDAKAGFEDTTKTIGKNKSDDEAALGKYAKTTKTKFQTDKDSATREIGRAGQTEDVNALRSMRGSLEDNLSTGRNARTELGTDGSARKELSAITSDKGRYEAAIGALDSIINSSMSGSVKQAAVKAVTDSAGLSDEEKKKVDQQYGDVYSEQAAL